MAYIPAILKYKITRNAFKFKTIGTKGAIIMLEDIDMETGENIVHLKPKKLAHRRNQNKSHSMSIDVHRTGKFRISKEDKRNI